MQIIAQYIYVNIIFGFFRKYEQTFYCWEDCHQSIQIILILPVQCILDLYVFILYIYLYWQLLSLGFFLLKFYVFFTIFTLLYRKVLSDEKREGSKVALRNRFSLELSCIECLNRKIYKIFLYVLCTLFSTASFSGCGFEPRAIAKLALAARCSITPRLDLIRWLS